jgi:hypothetical protein
LSIAARPSVRSAVRLMLLVSFFLTLSPPLRASGSLTTRTYLLWREAASRNDSLDQEAFEQTLQCIGYHPERLSSHRLGTVQLDSTVMLVVPHGAAVALAPEDVACILQCLREGLTVIADGKSPVSNALGLRLGKPARTSRVRDRLRPGLPISWPGKPEVSWIAGAPLPPPRVIYTDRASGHPLGIVMQVGRGRCLFLAPLLDPKSGRGFSRFPTLPDAIVKVLGCPPLLLRRGADAYFDPGFRENESLDSIARLWKHWGIRTVHAAAWHSYDDPPFDYRPLVEACHRNGILVYAWLEWPYIGIGFWDDHPEWRQKTALLKDAKFDFLYLMDLQNPACMSKALEELDSLLSLEWDGIDVAEFTLTGAGKQGLKGPVRPGWFTGFTDYCRAEFKSQEGFDPLELFNHRSSHYWRNKESGLEAFYRYRSQVNISTQHRLFSELDRINREQSRSWELILTIVDNSTHPEFDNLLGFDMDQTLALVKEFDVTLQVEDPYMEWTRPPERYVSVGAYYRNLLEDRPFVIDVNVVPMEEERKAGFPTLQAVGTEVFQCWKHATSSTDRVCFYCESSVTEEDWELMPYVMAASAISPSDSTGWRITTPSTVVMRNISGKTGFLLDDRPWNAYDSSGVIIPAGEHTLRGSGTRRDGMRLTGITGNLLGFQSDPMSCHLEYESRQRCALSFVPHPSRVAVDGTELSLPIFESGGITTIIAPRGKHTVVVSVD